LKSEISKLSQRMEAMNEGLPESGLFGDAVIEEGVPRAPFRISPQPIEISRGIANKFQSLGNHLLQFYKASNRLYLDSVRGHQPGWISELLDHGKSDSVKELGRLNRTKSNLPFVIRPDLMLTESDNLVVTELDSVPGGIGLLDALSSGYQSMGYSLVGAADGVVEAFGRALIDDCGLEIPSVAIVVSDESESYRSEMQAVSRRLEKIGIDANLVHPSNLDYQLGDLVMNTNGNLQKIDVLYRFFELHDLKNIPNVDFVFHAMRHRRVHVSPPAKAQLEEKLLLALFHHPELADYWIREIGDQSYSVLSDIIPPTWVLDPTKLPPFAAISPPLITAGKSIRRWSDLSNVTQKQRRMVVKPSGFSDLSWGARGVTIGHDVNQEVWASSVQEALQSFDTCPYVLQPYEQSRRLSVEYFDFDSSEVKTFDARIRYSPYYFVEQGEAKLAGVLATACPASSKILHGMSTAVMSPVMVNDD